MLLKTICALILAFGVILPPPALESETLGFLCGISLVGEAHAAPYGHKTVFRYRCYEGDHPPWVSPIDGVGGIDHSPGSGDIHRIVRGHGFERLLYADFNGGSEYIRSSEAVETVDTAGHDSFTIQAWFLAHSVSGYRCLISNTQDYRGFSLKIKNGQLRGLMRLENGGAHVNEEILGGTIQDSIWYYAALRVKENDDSYDMRLFVNGDEVAQRTCSHYDGIRQSTERPMVGAEPNGGNPDGDYFDGYLYAVSITNYAVGVTNNLENELIRDGSRYFGMVSYHDYLDTTDGPDHRISNTIDKYLDVDNYVTQRYYCPFMNDYYIPQGVTTNGSNRIYMSLYWKDTDGNTGQYPSILAEMSTDGKLLRTMRLYDENHQEFAGHVGGAAFWNGQIYIPDGRDVLRYDLSEAGSYYFDPDSFSHPLHDKNPLYAQDTYYDCDIAPNTEIDYLSASADADGSPILWTGDFTASSGDYRAIIGFAIQPDGGIDSADPLHHFTLPVIKAQGIYCHYTSPSHFAFYVSASWGDNPSHIYDVIYERGNPEAVSHRTVFYGPAGLEDLDMIGSQLWSVSESGGKHYQKRSGEPWEDLFPFVFAYENPRPTVYVDGGAFPGGDGTESSPFHLVIQGIVTASPGGTVIIRSGSYPETPAISRSLSLVALPGPVTIGSSGMNR